MVKFKKAKPAMRSGQARLPPAKSVRCKHFSDDGYPVGDSCPRYANACNFIHPEDDEWYLMSPYRGTAGESPLLAWSPSRRTPSPFSSSASLLTRIDRGSDEMPHPSDPRLRAPTFAASTSSVVSPEPGPSSSISGVVKSSSTSNITSPDLLTTTGNPLKPLVSGFSMASGHLDAGVETVRPLFEVAATYVTGEAVANISKLADLEKDQPKWDRLQKVICQSRIKIDGPGADALPDGIRNARAAQALIPHAGTHILDLQGGSMTVMEYFKVNFKLQIQHPDLFGIVVGRGAVIPGELCYVVEPPLPEQTMDDAKQDIKDGDMNMNKSDTTPVASRHIGSKDGAPAQASLPVPFPTREMLLATTLPTIPTPPPTTFNLSNSALQTNRNRAGRHIKKLVEAGRVENDLNETDNALDEQRTLLSALEHLGISTDAQKTVSSKITALEQKLQEKRSQQTALVAELAPDTWWLQPASREDHKVRFEQLDERLTKVHKELGATVVLHMQQNSMDIDGDSDHPPGAKRPFSAVGNQGQSNLRDEPKLSLPQQVDALKKHVDELKTSHVTASNGFATRLDRITYKLNRIELDRMGASDKRQSLLQRLATVDKISQHLSARALQLKGQRDVVSSALDEARANNTALKQSLESLEAEQPMTASKAAHIQKQLHALQDVISLQRTTTARPQVPVEELFNMIKDPLLQYAETTAAPLLNQYSHHCQTKLDSCRTRWAEDVVGRVSNTMDVVRRMIDMSEE